MVAFNKQRVQHDDETKRMIYEEYTTTRKSMAQVAEKYNINVNTVNNIVKKFKAQKKKEDQFYRDNNTYSKPKPKPLSVAQEVKRIEHTRKPENPQPKYAQPQQKPTPVPEKPKNELRKSARREVISINTSNGAPAEPFRPRPPKPINEHVNISRAEKKLERRTSIIDVLADYQEKYYK